MEDLLASALRSASDSVFILDRAGRFVFLNRVRRGLRLRDVVGRPLFGYLTPEARPIWRRHLRLVLRTGRPVSFETSFRDGQGRTVWYSNRLAPMRRAGRVEGVVAVCTDISERKLLEAKVEESETFWRSILSQAPNFITCLDRQGRFLFVNHLAKGLKLEDVIGKSVLDFLEPSSRPVFRRALASVVRTGQPERFRSRGVGKNGGLAWYDSRLAAIKRGGKVHQIISMGADITAETVTQARFEGLFKSSADAMNYISLDGVVLEVNPAYERLTGYSREELINNKRYQELTPPEHVDLNQKAIRHLLKEGTPYVFEKDYLHKNGSRVPVRLTTFVVKGPDGKPDGFAAIIEDISERRRLENEIVEAGAREQSKLGRDLHDTLGQTITGLSLLARSLRGSLNARLAPEAGDAARLAELSSLAVRQARGLARGLLPEELQKAGLREALEQLASNARDLFGIRCRIKCPRPLRLASEAVVVQLYRIAQEAVHNAAKHARVKSVRIILRQDRHMLRLAIRDEGRGIPAASRRGTGLGLGIMEHRARTLGARLTLRRRRGGGTEVVCDCPLGAGQVSR